MIPGLLKALSELFSNLFRSEVVEGTKPQGVGIFRHCFSVLCFWLVEGIKEVGRVLWGHSAISGQMNWGFNARVQGWKDSAGHSCAALAIRG